MKESTDQGGSRRRNRVVIVAITTLVLATVGTLVIWNRWPAMQPRKRSGEEPGGSPSRTSVRRQVPPDPRLTLATPYLNVRPEVRYVGDAACLPCHRAISKTFHEHPMGRSLAPVAEAVSIEGYDSKARPSFPASGFTFQAERRGDRLLHREWLLDPNGRKLAELEEEVRYTVGSGARGRSYLIEHDGYLFQSPLTWYAEKGLWDLAPGYTDNNLHFGRPIVGACLFCHCNQTEAVEYTSNRFRTPVFRGYSIGCERCHGPGELHVAKRRSGEAIEAEHDLTIVNPRHLEHSLREDVCRQCHLQGEQRIVRYGRHDFDYRPGLPLDAFVRDFVKWAPDSADRKFVGTVEQMVASRCYQESQGQAKLGCVACHDPHEQPSAQSKLAFYRQRCLGCHQDKGCTVSIKERRAKDDSCTACHMPRADINFPHLSITDHRVIRRPGVASHSSPESKSTNRNNLPLVPFAHGELEDVRRDLGLALLEYTEKLPLVPARQVAQAALPLLDEALAGDAVDASAMASRANALWYLGRKQEALAAFRAVLEKVPDYETPLFSGTSLASQLREQDLALGWGARLVKLNPWRWQYHQAFADALVLAGKWTEGAEECRISLRLHPAGLMARRLLILCLMRLRDLGSAQDELNSMLASTPAEQHGAIQRWFSDHARSSGLEWRGR